MPKSLLFKGTVANTLLDRHGERLAMSSLEGLAAQVNGSACISIGIEHDPSVPTIGKMLSAYVRERSDGEHELVAVQEVFGGPTSLKSYEEVFWKAESDTDRRPFRVFEVRELTEISVDPMNFESRSASSGFFKELRLENPDTEFADAHHLRKAVLGDPVLIFKIGCEIVGFLSASKLLGKLANEGGHRLAAAFGQLVDLILASATKYAIRCVPRNRPVTYVLQLSGNPDIEFVAVTAVPQLFVGALTDNSLRKAVAVGHSLRERFQALRVQFLLNESGIWEVNYLLTASGAVVGTRKSFARQKARLLTLRLPGQSEPTGQKADL